MRRTLKKKNLKAPLSCGEGLGVSFFLCTNLILNPSPHEKDFEKEKFKSSTGSRKNLFKNQCKSVKAASLVFPFHDEFYFYNIYLPFLRSNTWIINPILQD